MESATIASPLAERVTKVEVELVATKEDVAQINARLDRAARGAYFLGTAILTLASVILGAVVVPH